MVGLATSAVLWSSVELSSMFAQATFLLNAATVLCPCTPKGQQLAVRLSGSLSCWRQKDKQDILDVESDCTTLPVAFFGKECIVLLMGCQS